MNKELKYLLKKIKNITQDYVGINGCLYQDLSRKELDLLLNYVTNLQQENHKLKKRLKINLKINNEADIRFINFINLCENKVIMLQIQQKEFIKYLKDEITGYEATSNLLFSHNKEKKIYKEMLQEYKKIIGVDK